MSLDDNVHSVGWHDGVRSSGWLWPDAAAGACLLRRQVREAGVRPNRLEVLVAAAVLSMKQWGHVQIAISGLWVVVLFGCQACSLLVPPDAELVGRRETGGAADASSPTDAGVGEAGGSFDGAGATDADTGAPGEPPVGADAGASDGEPPVSATPDGGGTVGGNDGGGTDGSDGSPPVSSDW